MIVLDTSVVIDAFTWPKNSGPAVRAVLDQRERVVIPSLVFYEWLRGPRLLDELGAQERAFPREEALPFGRSEAAAAARLYKTVTNPRRRQWDLAIAACALTHDAELWTLNVDDFRDIPGLRLYWPR